MLPRERRVNKALFQDILKTGQSYYSPHMSLRASRVSPSDAPSAFAFVVSSKAIKQAADRNKVKRRGRAAVRKFLPDIKSGFRGAFFFKSESLALPYAEFEKEIALLLRKAHLL